VLQTPFCQLTDFCYDESHWHCLDRRRCLRGRSTSPASQLSHCPCDTCFPECRCRPPRGRRHHRRYRGQRVRIFFFLRLLIAASLVFQGMSLWKTNRPTIKTAQSKTAQISYSFLLTPILLGHLSRLHVKFHLSIAFSVPTKIAPRLSRDMGI
jgi:hypothetical protein